MVFTRAQALTHSSKELKRARGHGDQEPCVLPDGEPTAPQGVAPKHGMCCDPAPKKGRRRGGRLNSLTLATWNTQGWSFELSKYIEQLTASKDVIALTECSSKDGGAKLRSHAGPGLLVGAPAKKGDPAGTAAIALSRRAQSQVLNSGHRGSRIVWVRLKDLFKSVLIISVYVPHGGASRVNPSRADVLEELQDLLKSESTKGECVFVMGDFNSKLQRGVKGLTGKYCIHPRSDVGGERLLEIMTASHLFAASTGFCPPRKAPLGQATYIPVNPESGEGVQGRVGTLHPQTRSATRSWDDCGRGGPEDQVKDQANSKA